MNTINNSGVVKETTNAEATFKLNFAPRSSLTSSTCHLMYSVLLILHHIIFGIYEFQVTLLAFSINLPQVRLLTLTILMRTLDLILQCTLKIEEILVRTFLCDAH